MNTGASTFVLIQNGSVERVVDLDAVHDELARRRPQWTALGVTVGDFTWRDASAQWPQPLISDRAQVRDPESIGMSLVVCSEVEARLVLWTGGWADLDAVVVDHLVSDCPTFADVDSCVAVAQALIERLVRAAPPKAGPPGGRR